MGGPVHLPSLVGGDKHADCLGSKPWAKGRRNSSWIKTSEIRNPRATLKRRMSPIHPNHSTRQNLLYHQSRYMIERCKLKGITGQHTGARRLRVRLHRFGEARRGHSFRKRRAQINAFNSPNLGLSTNTRRADFPASSPKTKFL
jgi:hypothetical protein